MIQLLVPLYLRSEHSSQSVYFNEIVTETQKITLRIYSL